MIDTYQQSDADNDIEGTYATFALTAASLGIDAQMFELLGLELYKADYVTGTLSDDIAIDEDGNYLLEYQSIYTIISTNYIEGYASISPVTFKVVGALDENGVIVDTIKVANSDGTFSQASLEALASALTPERIIIYPVEVDLADSDLEVSLSDDSEEDEVEQEGTVYTASSSISSGSSTSYVTDTESEEDDLSLYDEEILLGENEGNANSDLSASLAKTGGFVGTLMAYIMAVAFILIGLYMVLGKKKDNEM